MAGQFKEKLHLAKEWILSHSKIVLPVVVLICVAITVAVALNANQKETEEQTVAAKTVSGESIAEVEIPEDALEENAYPEINALVNTYYAALAEGNVEAVEALNNYVDDTEKIRITEISKYIENYPVIDVYTKKGPVDNSYLVYVCSQVKFLDYENTVPGMQAFYICQKEDGSYFINEGEEDEAVLDYIRQVSLQDDVIDLNNKVAVEYNDLCASDSALSAFLAELDSQINISVGEILAAAEAQTEEAAAEETEQTTQEGDETAEAPESEAAGTTIQTARTTDVVNIRSSDSETADKLGKAQKGDTFTVLENKVNGWSRVKYEDKEAYIRSDYLEVINTETVPNDTEDEAEEPDNTASEEGTGEYVTVIENVNVRSGQSETSERIGVAYQGEKLELIMKLADGWCKIKYDGQTAYVKSDYVE